LFHCASLAFLLGSDRNVLRHQAKNGTTICAQSPRVAAQAGPFQLNTNLTSGHSMTRKLTAFRRDIIRELTARYIPSHISDNSNLTDSKYRVGVVEIRIVQHETRSSPLL
jgi:hypothetical protein